MKSLTMALIIGAVFCTSAYAQNGIRFEENRAANGLGDLFLFQYTPDSIANDSFQVTYFSRDLGLEVRSYLLVYDSCSKILHVNDSSVYNKYTKRKKNDVLILALYELKDTTLLLQSIFTSEYRTSEKKAVQQFVTVHGRIRSENYLSDGYFDYQSVPRNYSRTSLDMQLSVGDLPFRTGFFYTTESQDMNSFYFSFDYAQYKNNLLKKLNDKKKAELSAGIGFDLQEELNRAEREQFNINNLLSSPDYRNKLSESRSEMAYAISDTAFRKSRRFKKAQDFIMADSLKRIELADLDKLKNKLNTEELSRNRSFYTLNALSDERKMKETFAKHQVKTSGFGALNSLRRFDIGTFTPRYSTLVVDAIQMTGANIELNKGIAYGAACMGEIKSGFVNGGSERPYRSTLMVGRAGIKKENRYSLVLTGLRGNGRSAFFSGGAEAPYLSNQVLAAEGTWQLNKTFGIRTELATSAVQTDKVQPYELSPLNKDKRELPGFSAAGLASLFYHSKNEGTQAELLVQQTGPAYFSIATPYLRKDNRRTELKLNQRIYKTYISWFNNARLESDNLFNTKQGTTYTTILTSGVKLMPAKMPWLIVSYSPLWQYSRPAPGISLTNRMNMYSFTAGYTYTSKNVINTSTLSYVKNSTYLYNLDLNRQLLEMNSFVLANQWLYKPSQTQAGITLSSMNHMMTGAYNDSLTFTESKGVDLMLTQKLQRINSSVEAGYSYITFIPGAHRHGMRAGFSTTFAGLTLNLRAEKYLTRKTGSTQTLHVFRITLIKSF